MNFKRLSKLWTLTSLHFLTLKNICYNYHWQKNLPKLTHSSWPLNMLESVTKTRYRYKICHVPFTVSKPILFKLNNKMTYTDEILQNNTSFSTLMMEKFKFLWLLQCLSPNWTFLFASSDNNAPFHSGSSKSAPLDSKYYFFWPVKFLPGQVNFFSESFPKPFSSIIILLNWLP